MTNAIQLAPEGQNLAAAVVVRGDLSGLNDTQLKAYYVELCHSLDLNPATQPFSLLTLNGKKMFYANKSCSDQLRKRDCVSVTIVSREHVDDLLVVTARATLPNGRTDESVGALPLGKLQGEARANAIMKCETKAKRRVTLSICGLGMLDESEVEGAMATERHHAPPQLSQVNPHTEPDEKPDAPEDSDVARTLLSALEGIKMRIATCATYEEALTLRTMLGTRAQQSELTKLIQKAGEAGDINAATKQQLGKLWMHCDRQVAKLEKQLATGPEDALAGDDADGADAFGPTREPGEEG